MITAVIPAAGLGTRLGRPEPKALVPVQGRSLVGHVLDALSSSVDRAVLVVRPGTEELFAHELLHLGWQKPVITVTQAVPSGSADAVALGLGPLAPDDACMVVWADQVGVRERTVARVASLLRQGFAGLALPLVEVEGPYVWFTPAPGAMAVGRRRDGDVPPPRGLSDVGIFGFRAGAAREAIAAHFVVPAPGRERDFVYVLPQLAREHGLATIDVDFSSEAVGVNDDADLARAQGCLARQVGR